MTTKLLPFLKRSPSMPTSGKVERLEGVQCRSKTSSFSWRKYHGLSRQIGIYPRCKPESSLSERRRRRGYQKSIESRKSSSQTSRSRSITPVANEWVQWSSCIRSRRGLTIRSTMEMAKLRQKMIRLGSTRIETSTASKTHTWLDLVRPMSLSQRLSRDPSTRVMSRSLERCFSITQNSRNQWIVRCRLWLREKKSTLHRWTLSWWPKSLMSSLR